MFLNIYLQKVVIIIDSLHNVVYIINCTETTFSSFEIGGYKLSMLAKLRKEKGMTQTEIATMFGIDQKTWSAYERNTRTPRPKTMQMIEDFFGVPKEKIFYDVFNYKM